MTPAAPRAFAGGQNASSRAPTPTLLRKTNQKSSASMTTTTTMQWRDAVTSPPPSSSESPGGSTTLRWRDRKKVFVGMKKEEEEEEEEESGDEWTLSRRGALVGKAALVLCEATAFPWLSEYYTRPKGDSYYDAGGVLGDGFKATARADDAVVPFSRAFFESLLPAEYAEYDVLRAKECLKTGESLMEEEKWDQAIVSLRQIEKLLPREYKLNQKAKLLIAECYEMMGAPRYFKEEYLEAKGSVWWWGRGLRWPGWYIIAYLGARHVYFESRNDTVGEASIAEGILISVLGVSYLILLNQFGLPDV